MPGLSLRALGFDVVRVGGSVTRLGNGWEGVADFWSDILAIHGDFGPKDHARCCSW